MSKAHASTSAGEGREEEVGEEAAQEVEADENDGFKEHATLECAIRLAAQLCVEIPTKH